MRALLIANAVDADAGFIGERFRHHGYAFTECHRERPEEWPDLDGFELVLLLGSEWSVYWPHVADNVAAEATLIREADRRGVPQFGICFGCQSMAHAFGGTVERAREPEIGWYDVTTDEPEWLAAGPWLEWHYDVVTVPPGAEEIARSAVGPQAWRLRKNFATQFHPEATESVVARWSLGGGGDELARFGSSRQELLDTTREHVQISREQAYLLVDHFVESLSSHPR
jgi:GMP synthase-like glutamine amidotransferase